MRFHSAWQTKTMWVIWLAKGCHGRTFNISPLIIGGNCFQCINTLQSVWIILSNYWKVSKAIVSSIVIMEKPSSIHSVKHITYSMESITINIHRNWFLILQLIITSLYCNLILHSFQLYRKSSIIMERDKNKTMSTLYLPYHYYLFH